MLSEALRSLMFGIIFVPTYVNGSGEPSFLDYLIGSLLSSIGMSLPYLAAFIGLGTIAVIAVIFYTWNVITGHMLLQAIWVWLLYVLGGMALLVIALIAGLFLSAIVGTLATAIFGYDDGWPGPVGILQFSSMIFGLSIVGAILSHTFAGAQQRSVQTFLPHMQRSHWMNINMSAWVVAFPIALIMGMVGLKLMSSIGSILGMSSIGAIVGLLAAVKLMNLVEESY